MGEDLLATRSNYLVGDESAWRTDVQNFGSVLYESVYAGVDMRYYGTQGQLSYDFLVAAGADASQIALRFEGADAVTIDATTGDLIIAVGDRTVSFRAPVTYQLTADGSRQIVQSAYEICTDGSVGFTLGNYDPTRALVIDPTLSWATFFGGTGTKTLGGVAVDGSGNLFVTGSTTSSDFPTVVGAYDSSANGGSDIFVARLAANGASFVYATYVGGTGNDNAYDIAVDASGRVYVAGASSSATFPTVNAYDTSVNGQDAVVFMLNAAGNALLYSTYLGGSGIELASSVAVDSGGNIIVGGTTLSGQGGAASNRFPLVNAIIDSTFSSQEGFVARFNPSLTTTATLTLSTYYGDTGIDSVQDVAVDAAGNIYITGITTAQLAQITGSGYDTTYNGGDDGFLARLDSTGTSITYGTMFGGSSNDYAYGIAIGPTGIVYVVGESASNNFITTGAGYDITHNGLRDGYLLAFDTTLGGNASLVGATYFGSTGLTDEFLTEVAVDSSGNVWALGHTTGSSITTTGSPLSAASGGGNDAMLLQFNASLGSLTYSTYLGGSGNESAAGLAVDASGAVYAGINTSSTAFNGVTGANSLGPGSGGDGFVVKLAEAANAAPTATNLSAAETYTEDTARNLIDIVISDADSATVTATLTLSNTAAGSLNTATSGTATSTYNPLTGVWTASGALADVNSLLAGLTFTPAANFNSSFTIATSVSDGTSTVTGTKTITGTAVNDAPVLSVSGSATVTQGTPYTLNLSATDADGVTITSWTINWGDGTVTTYAGNPSSVTHTYTRSGFTFNILAAATDADGTWLQNTLLVPRWSGGANDVGRLVPGAPSVTFFGSGSLTNAVDVAQGPDGRLYVSGYSSDNIVRFNADGTGATVFVASGSGGLNGAAGIAFGPDGHLYAASGLSNQILRFNGSTGAFIDVFASGGGMNNPNSLVFGQDGALYVANYNNSDIVRFDASTGAALGIFASNPAINGAEEMVFGPDGNLYLASRAGNAVLRFDSSGVYLGAFASTAGMTSVGGITFGPDGHLYVSDWGSDSVRRFNGSTGALMGTVIAGGLADPQYLNFLAQQQVRVLDANDAPSIVDATVTLDENSANGTAVTNLSDSFTGSDLDRDGQPITYSIVGGNTNGAFAIDSASGAITVANSAALDYETTPTFTLTVSASDGTLSDTAIVTVNLNNVNEAPTITSGGGGATAALSMAENSITVMTVTSSDVDGDAPVYSIVGGADAARFAIDATNGVLTFAAAPDHETPSDVGLDNQYEVLVEAADGRGGVATQLLRVAVTGVNEVPTANADSIQTALGQSVMVASTTLLANDSDIDGDSLTVVGVSTPAHGSISLDASGVWRYTPNPGFVGADSFSYTVADAAGLTATAQVSVAVVDSVFSTPPPTDPASNQPASPPTSETAPPVGVEESGPSSDAEEAPTTSAVDPGAPAGDGSTPSTTLPVMEQPVPILPWSNAGLSSPLARYVKGLEHEHLAQIRHWAHLGEFEAKSVIDQVVSESGQVAANLMRSLLRDGTAEDLRKTLHVLSETFDVAQNEADGANREVAEVVVGTSIALSVGMVAWLLRGGAMLAALLSSVPAWSSFDPIPVILRRRERRVGSDVPPTAEDIEAERKLARILRPDGGYTRTLKDPP